MDGIEPENIERVERALANAPQILTVDHVRLRWIGHRMHGEALVRVDYVSLSEANRIATTAEESVKKPLPKVDSLRVQTIARSPALLTKTYPKT